MSRPDTSARSQRSLALAGDRASGIAWMLGLIDGLRRRDADVAAADLIGAAIPPGALEQAVERQTTGRLPLMDLAAIKRKSGRRPRGSVRVPGVRGSTRAMGFV